jgi:tripartite-type tricarboxylate transporter receptor subunit TctC
VNALGVTSKTRHASLPNVPTIAEAGVEGYESYVWWGVFVAGSTPARLVSRLQADLAACIQSEDVSERLRTQGIDPSASTPEAFEGFFLAEVEKWSKVVKQAGVKVE